MKSLTKLITISYSRRSTVVCRQYLPTSIMHGGQYYSPLSFFVKHDISQVIYHIGSTPRERAKIWKDLSSVFHPSGIVPREKLLSFIQSASTKTLLQAIFDLSLTSFQFALKLPDRKVLHPYSVKWFWQEVKELSN